MPVVPEVNSRDAVCSGSTATRGAVAGNRDVVEVLHVVGARDGYIARQLKRWYGQFQGSQEQEKAAGVYREAAIVHEVHDQLVARKPEQLGAVIAHGDYRLDNCLVSPEGDMVAVLDWELCTLGDPLAEEAGGAGGADQC